MREYQIRFLEDNIGFDLSELSIKRQIELQSIIDNQRVSIEFIYAALSFKSLSEWEKWGFGLFFVENFSERVFDYLDAVEDCTEKELEDSTRKDFIQYGGSKKITQYNRLKLNQLSEDKDYRLHFDDMLGWQIYEL